jgi:hypothetical protein
MAPKILLIAALLFTLPAMAEFNNANIVKETGDKTSCIPKRVQTVLNNIQKKFKKVIIKSGYRAPADNARRGGAKGSLHMSCRAIDFLIPNHANSNQQRQLLAFLKEQKSQGQMRYNIYPTGRAHIDDSNLCDSYQSKVEHKQCGQNKNYKRPRKYS